MTMVRTEAIGDVLLIEIHNPPINVGSLGVRQGVKAAAGLRRHLSCVLNRSTAQLDFVSEWSNLT